MPKPARLHIDDFDLGVFPQRSHAAQSSSNARYGQPISAPTLRDDLALAQHIVETTAPIGLRYIDEGFTSEEKPDGTIVTAADLAVERAILDILADQRREDSVLSEESGASGSSSRRWIIDPIDGTSHYAAGRPTWSTFVALEIDGEIALAVIDRPALGVRYWAARGMGAHSNVGPVELSRAASLREARVTANPKATRHVDALRNACVWSEPSAEIGFDLLTGQIEVLVLEDFGQPWDHAPFVVIVEEAGGAFFDLDGGRRIDTRHSVYTTGDLAGPVRELLGVPPG